MQEPLAAQLSLLTPSGPAEVEHVEPNTEPPVSSFTMRDSFDNDQIRKRVKLLAGERPACPLSGTNAIRGNQNVKAYGRVADTAAANFSTCLREVSVGLVMGVVDASRAHDVADWFNVQSEVRYINAR